MKSIRRLYRRVFGRNSKAPSHVTNRSSFVHLVSANTPNRARQRMGHLYRVADSRQFQQSKINSFLRPNSVGGNTDYPEQNQYPNVYRRLYSSRQLSTTSRDTHNSRGRRTTKPNQKKKAGTEQEKYSREIENYNEEGSIRFADTIEVFNLPCGHYSQAADNKRIKKIRRKKNSGEHRASLILDKKTKLHEEEMMISNPEEPVEKKLNRAIKNIEIRRKMKELIDPCFKNKKEDKKRFIEQKEDNIVKLQSAVTYVFKELRMVNKDTIIDRDLIIENQTSVMNWLNKNEKELKEETYIELSEKIQYFLSEQFDKEYKKLVDQMLDKMELTKVNGHKSGKRYNYSYQTDDFEGFVKNYTELKSYLDENPLFKFINIKKWISGNINKKFKTKTMVFLEMIKKAVIIDIEKSMQEDLREVGLSDLNDFNINKNSEQITVNLTLKQMNIFSEFSTNLDGFNDKATEEGKKKLKMKIINQITLMSEELERVLNINRKKQMIARLNADVGNNLEEEHMQENYNSKSIEKVLDFMLKKVHFE